MYHMRVLNCHDLGKVLSMPEVVDCVEDAYRLFSAREAGLWPVIFHEFEPGVRDMDIKSGYLEGAGLFGLKIVGYSADNPVKLNAPALSGLVMVMSIETGQPLGLVDGMTVTNLRTGAAGAIGAKWLARKNSRKVLILGAGAQGRAQCEGLMAVMPDLESVTFSSRHTETARACVEELTPRYGSVKLDHVDWENIAEPASNSDIIVTCTPARKGFLRKEWIQPGTHINAIGADMTLKQEIDPQLVAAASLFVDSQEQTLHHGECHHAYEQGLISEEDVTEIGSVILGQADGRNSSEEITMFDATGMALQDIITANLALNRAAKKGLGSVVTM
ncbi:MAG: ornithine cyclodeaminase family protein [Synergistales bacterium]|nr:ornithine cyclodeaminase family protein [Synergistales bacterium]